MHTINILASDDKSLKQTYKRIKTYEKKYTQRRQWRSESTCNIIRKIVKEELEHQEQNMIEI